MNRKIAGDVTSPECSLQRLVRPRVRLFESAVIQAKSPEGMSYVKAIELLSKENLGARSKVVIIDDITQDVSRILRLVCGLCRLTQKSSQDGRVTIKISQSDRRSLQDCNERLQRDIVRRNPNAAKRKKRQNDRQLET